MPRSFSVYGDAHVASKRLLPYLGSPEDASNLGAVYIFILATVNHDVGFVYIPQLLLQLRPALRACIRRLIENDKGLVRILYHEFTLVEGTLTLTYLHTN